MRDAGDWTPVLFVTARDDEVERVLGLELGADDYVTKPFSPRELVARVKTVIRRSDRADRAEGGRATGRSASTRRSRTVTVEGDGPAPHDAPSSTCSRC